MVIRVFRFTTGGFLRVGHSHEDIDGAFGAIAHDIYLTEFDDADGVVDVLNKPGGKKNSYAYKLDEVALWKN